MREVALRIKENSTERCFSLGAGGQHPKRSALAFGIGGHAQILT